MPVQSYLCSTDEEFLSIEKYKTRRSGLYHVHDRRNAEPGGRKQYSLGHEKRQDTGQLPSPVYVLT